MTYLLKGIDATTWCRLHSVVCRFSPPTPKITANAYVDATGDLVDIIGGMQGVEIPPNRRAVLASVYDAMASGNIVTETQIQAYIAGAGANDPDAQILTVDWKGSGQSATLLAANTALYVDPQDGSGNWFAATRV